LVQALLLARVSEARIFPGTLKSQRGHGFLFRQLAEEKERDFS
jgi:hypothetical protein